MSRWMSVCLLTLLSSSCGWQLQGALRIPAELLPLKVEYQDEHSALSRALRDRLRIAGVAQVDDANVAQTVLTVLHDEPGERVASVSSTNQPTEYEVFYAASFSLKQKHGDQPEIRRDLRESQVISYDKKLELAKEREAHELSDRMAASMADQIVRQLGTALRVRTTKP
jgi:outer membrane lipopolysaccharide assembly protein LptE/RlpB